MLLPRWHSLLWVAAALVTLLAGRTAHAQSPEAGNAGDIYLWVGGGASGYYIQYGQVKNLGITAYVDADTVRRFGIEAEGRWLEFHQTNEIHADTYLVGPRYHFNANRFQPYVKGLAGIGHFTFPYNYAHGSYFVIAPGGGLDYRLGRRWSVRADFEYQFWPQFTFGAMSSGGATVGVRYLILK
jgi:Outer membrane protein beta-barrel domain